LGPLEVLNGQKRKNVNFFLWPWKAPSGFTQHGKPPLIILSTPFIQGGYMRLEREKRREVKEKLEEIGDLVKL
jgi:hypothetical protein